MGLKKKSALASTLFWGVISAAFIGPGTVTTASKAGSSYGLSLLWALVFSVFATIVLQETVARIRISSGLSLGQIIRLKFPRWQRLIRWASFACVVFGCAAYEAGNLIGAVAGVAIIYPDMELTTLLIIGFGAFALLWTGTTDGLARIMGLLVASMGLAYLLVAFNTEFSIKTMLEGAFVPGWEDPSSAWIAIALIGTTIVPYNLFLGSGLSHGQSIPEMRKGLIPAIVLGGFVSAAIMVVGTRVEGPFSFEAMALALSSGLGSWAVYLFGFGLFAAGLTSAVTAPLAAAMTGRVLLSSDKWRWNTHSVSFRGIWILMLAIGIFFATSGIKPIPAIITAQAVNGILLPLVAWVIWLIARDQKLLHDYANSVVQHIIFILILLLTFLLGAYNIYKATQAIFG